MVNISKLYCEGNNDLLNSNCLKLGIVGSRSIISYTKNILEDLFEDLKNYNFCIISGGMYGVDMFAHNLALENNLKTIFVLPQGIKSYKSSSLYSQIKFKSNSNYLFISEYDDYFTPRKYSFLERNKVISEMSDLLLVAQASLKSGSISTANHTLKLKKRLITFPFSLENSQFQGTNLLIDKGAQIYLNPSSVLGNFGIYESNIEDSIIKELKLGSFTFEKLLDRVESNSELLKKSVLKLILEGQIFYDGENYFI